MFLSTNTQLLTLAALIDYVQAWSSAHKHIKTLDVELLSEEVPVVVSPLWWFVPYMYVHQNTGIIDGNVIFGIKYCHNSPESAEFYLLQY